MTFTLDFLPQTAFAFLLIFARVGAMTMALPGIGDKTVPPRVRLVFALALTLILYPVVQNKIGILPATLVALAAGVIAEAIIGIMIGFAVRLITSAVHLAGSAIAFQTGLAFAQSVDPQEGTQSAIFATFFSVLSVTLIFATNLHHLLIGAMNDSYQLFQPGQPIPIGDFAESAVGILSKAFRIALQLAAPFIVFGLIFNVGVGVLSRLTPQIQVFFIFMPANIMMGLVLLMLLLSSMMLWYLSYFGDAVGGYLVGG